MRVTRLMTLYDEASERVRFHGVPTTVMRVQAAALAVPLSLYPTTPATFETAFLSALAEARAAELAGVIFGNIHLADVRAWYEERVRAAGLEHIEPLWGEVPGHLAREVVARGYAAIVTCIDASQADPAWLGQPLTEELITAFERKGIDACGEHGEYHTLVTNGPLFRAPLALHIGETRLTDAPTTASRFHQLDVRLQHAVDEGARIEDVEDG